MLDWLRSLFGKGVVQISWNGIDPEGKIINGDGKVPYTGVYNEMSVKDIFKKELMQRHNILALKINVTQHVQE